MKLPKINWRPYRPYLAMHLEFGFMGFQTVLMKQAYERYVYDYIRLEWRFFRWRGGFNLYKPGNQ
jgi:hypothetical protein